MKIAKSSEPLDAQTDIAALMCMASHVSLPMLVSTQARLHPDEAAIADGAISISRAELQSRSLRMAAYLLDAGMKPGDRIALLAENDAAYIELALAAARQGLILAMLNWRLTAAELGDCLVLVKPALIFVSPAQDARVGETLCKACNCVVLGPALEEQLMTLTHRPPDVSVDPEAGLFIAFTSGTSGLPKGAIISHRAALARLQLYIVQFGFKPGDTFMAWSPMFHMSSMELALSTLVLGGTVVISRGLDLRLMGDLLEAGPISNLVLFPGIIDEALAYMRERQPRIVAIRKFGALADLLAVQYILQLSAAFQTPFANTYAATETGIAPASAGQLAIGEIPTDLAKTESVFCDVKLVDEQDREVASGETGELAMRGPTVFSGYWGAPDATAQAFRGGWYHTGDMFRRRADGRLDYIDRQKYLIKSGGENIYPAEIEGAARGFAAVTEAAVVRRQDVKWGEVPVLVVASRGGEADREGLATHLAVHLARYKQPREIVFVQSDFFPRNNTGKILRGELEAKMA